MFKITLEIKEVVGKGRSIFATQPFKAGDIIERAPVIVLPAKDWPNIKKSVLYNYVFAWGTIEDQTALALGYGSLYNHSYKPCAYYKKHEENSYLEIVALRNIQTGEEITINYHGVPDCDEPLWFDTHSEDPKNS